MLNMNTNEQKQITGGMLIIPKTNFEKVLSILKEISETISKIGYGKFTEK